MSTSLAAANSPGAGIAGGYPWMQELGTSEATAFLRKHGVVRAASVGMTSLPGNLMLDAVRDGQGIGVTARVFVEADIAAGRLRLLFEDNDREGYFMVTGPGIPRASLRRFTAWVMGQVIAQNIGTN